MSFALAHRTPPKERRSTVIVSVLADCRTEDPEWFAYGTYLRDFLPFKLTQNA